TLAEERYLGLSARRAAPRLNALLDWAAANGRAFALLWHPDRFDPLSSGGWDRLYSRVLDGVQARGGACVSAGELSSHSTCAKERSARRDVRTRAPSCASSSWEISPSALLTPR